MKPLAVLLDPNRNSQDALIKIKLQLEEPRGAFMDLVLNVKYQLS